MSGKDSLLCILLAHAKESSMLVDNLGKLGRCASLVRLIASKLTPRSRPYNPSITLVHYGPLACNRVYNSCILKRSTVIRDKALTTHPSYLAAIVWVVVGVMLLKTVVCAMADHSSPYFWCLTPWLACTDLSCVGGVTYPFTDLLNSVHDTIEQRDQLFAYKFGTVFLNKVPTIDSYERADSFPLIRDLC